MSKSDYNKIYKDHTRIVVYSDPEDKSYLAQYALDNGISLSTLVEPKIKELVNELKSRASQSAN